MVKLLDEFIGWDGQDETRQVENKIDLIKIPFEFVVKLPKMRKARSIVLRDGLGRIVSSVV